ncbi:MAG: sigma-70 family RNA polymerase sigma factor [Deltaproteobacteria bacterium]|nr:sigma-70 family RNA polymerase sigma factor [Deltaproteobacteria bacterium]
MTGSDEYLYLKLYEHEKHINDVVKHRVTKPGLAEEVLAYVMVCFEEDQFRRLKEYKHESSFITYVKAVANRLTTDFFRKRYGYVRPPKWVVARGLLWKRVFQMLCLERMTFADVINGLTVICPDPDPSLAMEVEKAVETISGNISDCGQKIGEELLDDRTAESYLGEEGARHNLPPEELTLSKERAAFMEVFREIIFSDNKQPDNPDDTGLDVLIEKFQTGLKLSAEERLLLKLQYQDGLSVSDVGRRLGLNPDQIHGKRRRLLDKLRKALESSGLDRLWQD